MGNKPGLRPHDRKAKLMTTTQPRLFWRIENSGEICQHWLPQLAGASEGEAGPATGIRLEYDRSDCRWELYFDAKEVLSDIGTPPDVEECMAWRVAPLELRQRQMRAHG